MSLLQQLQQVPAIGHVPTEQLQWLIEHSECRHLGAGDLLFEKDLPSEYMFIVLEGRIRVWLDQNGQSREVARLEPGDITGVLPYSRLKKANGYGVVLQAAQIFTTHRDHFPEMIREQYELTEALVHQMTNRVRDFTAMQQQNEKLLSLGKLSAGLAHELNNPASAAVRAAQDLKQHVGYLPDRFKRVIKIRMEDAQIDAVNGMVFAKVAAGPVELSLIQRNEREDELTDWLEDHDVEQADDFVENLVDFGFREEDLDQILAQTTERELGPVLGWVDQVITTERLVSEIQDATGRISGLVKSIKAYSHMDQDQDRQAVSLRDGIYNTLTMLKHKLKKNRITLNKHFPPDLPTVSGFPGELNQVWTNLIDNAIDAMPEGGTLTITAEVEGPCVLLTLRDTGAGIPPEVLPRIFDPFFTTKPMGEGTGLGLDVVQRIVRHHRATIQVDSEPGRTEFRIYLPIE
jgi:signal transduction histidine kinase